MNKVNLDFIEKCIGKYSIKPTSVLDVGSLDVNGGPRHLFKCDYLGIDPVDGPSVDSTIPVKMMPLDKKFDTVICLNMLEHSPTFMTDLLYIHELVEKSGYFFLSVPGIGFPEHHQPDYWRFTKRAVKEIIMGGFEVLEYEEVPTKPNKNYIINCLGRKL